MLRLVGGLLGLALLGQDPATFVRETAHARVAKAQAIARDAELLQAVRDKNAAGESETAIRQKDRQWIADKTFALRKQLTQSPCAARLRKLIEDDKLIVEALLMDERGALVCASAESSDYWQGDEPKWQKTYGEGKPAFVDEPALDQSAGTYAIQLSVPVREGPGRIGALTLTLRLARGQLSGPKP